MLHFVNILAADDDTGSLITLVIAIAMAAFVALARYFENRLKSKAEQESQDADKGAPERPARPGEQAPQRQQLKPVQRPSPFEAAQAPQAQRLGEREIEQPQPVLKPVAPAGRPQAARPAPPSARRAQQRQQPRARTVEEEIGRLREHLRKLERLRADRMEVETPLEADTAAIEARLLRIHPAIITPSASGRGLGVDLSDLAAARSAIVYHEIFSPPKALREGPETWEL